MTGRWIGAASLVALLAGGCADDDTASSTTSTSTSSTTTTASSSSTTASSTTTPTTVAPPTTGTSIVVPSSVPDLDRDAPAPAKNVTCAPGGGSGELTLEWDAPAAADEVAIARVYFQEGTGGFASPNESSVASGAVRTDLAAGTRWSTVAIALPSATPIEIGVALVDGAGNESSFVPIDAYLAFAGAECATGPPPAPPIASISRGAGSLEIDLRVTPPAPDVVDYRIEADAGDGFAPLDILTTAVDVASDEVLVVAFGADWSADVVYRLRAVDAHGFLSPPTDRSCAPLLTLDDVC